MSLSPSQEAVLEADDISPAIGQQEQKPLSKFSEESLPCIEENVAAEEQEKNSPMYLGPRHHGHHTLEQMPSALYERPSQLISVEAALTKSSDDKSQLSTNSLKQSEEHIKSGPLIIVNSCQENSTAGVEVQEQLIAHETSSKTDMAKEGIPMRSMSICEEASKPMVAIQPVQRNSLNIDTQSERKNLTGASPTSMFAQMSKQPSRRDMKQWASSGRNQLGVVSSHKDSLNLSASSDLNGSTLSVARSPVNVADRKLSSNQSDNDDGSENMGGFDSNTSTPQRRTFSLIKKSNGIKIANSISTQLKKNNFQDDDLITFNEEAYSALAKCYDNQANIEISAKTLLKKAVNSFGIPMAKEKTTAAFPSIKIHMNSSEEAQLDQSSEAATTTTTVAADNQKFESLAELITTEPSRSKQQKTVRICELPSTTNKVALPVLFTVKTKDQLVGYQSPSRQATVVQGTAFLPNLESQRSNGTPQGSNEKEESAPPALAPSGFGSILLNQSQNLEFYVPNSNSAPDFAAELNSLNNSESFGEISLSTLAHHESLPVEPQRFSHKQLLQKSIQPRLQAAKHFKNNASLTSSGIFQPNRFPIDLICVIDTSGSMNGEPLSLLKETLLFLIDLLQNGDRISLIQFSTNAKRLTPLLSIDSSTNKSILKQEIDQLIAKGGTNINQGMQLAFDVLKQRRHRNPITSVFLLSDGLNDGAENRVKDLLKQLNFYQNYSEESFTIQTFGFGKDHDPNMMDKISQLMDGNFYFIGDIHRIDECFIDALGGLFSVISQNVAITVSVPSHMREKVRILKTYGEIWQQKEEGYVYEININQLLSGVSKDYILEIEVDSSLLDEFSDAEGQLREEEVSRSSASQQHFLTMDLHAANISLKTATSPSSPSVYSQASPGGFDYISPNSSIQSLPQVHLFMNESKLDESTKEGIHSAGNSEQVAAAAAATGEQEKQQQQEEQCINKSAAQLEGGTGITSAHNMDNKVMLSSLPPSINVIPPENGIYSSVKSIDLEGNEKVEVRIATLEDPSNHIHANRIVRKSEKLCVDDPNCIAEAEVNLHYLRVRGAEGLEKCSSLALAKRFDEGSDLVSRLLQELNDQEEDTQQVLSTLIKDLKEVQDVMRKKVSETFGWQRMISCKRMHMEQRSTGTELAYQNSVQKIMVQRRQNIKQQGGVVCMAPELILKTRKSFREYEPIVITTEAQQPSETHDQNASSSDEDSDGSSMGRSSKDSLPSPSNSRPVSAARGAKKIKKKRSSIDHREIEKTPISESS